MDPKEALSIVAQACAAFRGTLQDHEMIQRALGALTERLGADTFALEGGVVSPPTEQP